MHIAKAISSIFYTTYTLPHRTKPAGESDKKCNRVGHMLTVSCIRRAIVCAGIVVQMLLCSSSVIDGVFQRLCQCRRVTFEAA